MFRRKNHSNSEQGGEDQQHKVTNSPDVYLSMLISSCFQLDYRLDFSCIYDSIFLGICFLIILSVEEVLVFFACVVLAY